MSYKKTDGRMKEGHMHITDDGKTWIVINQQLVEITNLKQIK